MIHEYYTTKHEKSKHLTIKERGQIEILLKQNVKKTKIAEIIGISRSTLYEELKRGTVDQLDTNLRRHRVYFADTAQSVYDKNRKWSVNAYKYMECSDFLQYVEDQILNNKMSPETICGYVRKTSLFEHTVCAKTIYNYIDLGLIHVKNIDSQLKVKYNAKKQYNRKHKKILGKSIDERPQLINDRQEFGHWEIDTVIGTKRKGAPVLLTLTERVTRKLITVKIASRIAEAVNEAIKKIIDNYGENSDKIFKSITSDNGSEFSSLSDALKYIADVYFAHPYSSFERGTNEKHNSLLRRFFPKGRSFAKLSDEAIHKAQEWINNLPRKMFNYSCPNELFYDFVNSL